jgi:hypothetical protein
VRKRGRDYSLFSIERDVPLPIDQQIRSIVPSSGRPYCGRAHNAKGQLIARDVADLHGDIERDRNNIRKPSALNEKGLEVKGDRRRRVALLLCCELIVTGKREADGSQRPRGCVGSRRLVTILVIGARQQASEPAAANANSFGVTCSA